MHVAKWGNGLAVRLPKQLVDELGLKAGDEVVITSAGVGELVIEKSRQADDFLERMKALRQAIPPDYVFNRDEANER